MDRGNWKISIGATEICNYTDCSQGGEIGGGPEIATEMLALALGSSSSPLYQNMGNVQRMLEFTITREHADNAASVDWYLNGALNLAGVSDVTFTHRDISGAESSYKVSAAKVLMRVSEPVNVTTTTRLTVTGGAAIKL